MSENLTHTESLLIRASQEAARRPDVGRNVRVVAGRKVPKGTEGVVFYNRLHPIRVGGRTVRVERRIGFRDADGTTHFTSESNLEVLA